MITTGMFWSLFAENIWIVAAVLFVLILMYVLMKSLGTTSQLRTAKRGAQDEEAKIIVAGVQLTEAQARAVRVALNSFIADLRTNGLRDDDTGKRLTDIYVENSEAVLSLVHGRAFRPHVVLPRRRT